jgi:hypothetical protein
VAAADITIDTAWQTVMSGILYCAAPGWAGVWHRFRTLNNIKAFVMHSGFRPCYLWGVSQGVSHCTFEELLSPIPGFEVINMPEAELAQLEQKYRQSDNVVFRGQTLAVYRRGVPKPKTLVFDLWGDFAESTALTQEVPSHLRLIVPVRARPADKLRREAESRIREWDLGRRIGIRVRVTENPKDGRPLCRMQKQLDNAIKAIIRMPWYVRVFVVTDSDYVQQMLASHFRDIRFISKGFALSEPGGRYVNRNDAAAMRNFMIEVTCLLACPRIINFGGFLNEELVRNRMIEPSHDPKVLLSLATELDRPQRG